MRVWSKTTLKPLLVPGALLLFVAAALGYSGWLTLALPALTFLYYCAVVGGIVLAWRFHSSRIFLSLCVLFLADEAIALLGAGQPASILMMIKAATVLVPLNFIVIALMHERGFTVESMTPVGLFLFVQFVVLVVLDRAAEMKPLPGHARHLSATVPLPDYAWLVFAAAGLFLLARFLVTRKPADSALLWSLCAFFLSLHFAGSARLSTLYAVTAACILSTSIIESSYLLAYHDELTTLPSRRAFNDAVLRLQEPYSIAVADIDHFKRFNDTYGHDIGDQVLRLVASNLARVTGGGRAYRCGGEEFMILFPGKSTADVIEHLERLRAAIELSEFHMRGDDRRRTPRGPERRDEKNRRRPSKGQAIRELAQGKAPSSLSVTVSIGVASPSRGKSDSDSVLKAADKALYRAKQNGRNRVESAATTRRSKAKAVEIA